MKKYISFLGVLLAVLILPETGYPGYVKGYYRKNGTYVAPHYRKDRGSSSTYKPSTSTYKRSSSTTYTPSSSTYSSGSSSSSSVSTRVRPVSSTVKSSGGAVASEAEEMSREEQTTRDRLRQIDEAIAAYKSKNEGRLPKSLQELWRSTSNLLMTSDGWGSRFDYKTDETDYLLSSKGVDRKSGTLDDIYSVKSTGVITGK